MATQDVRARAIYLGCFFLTIAFGIFLRLPPSGSSNNGAPIHATPFLHPQSDPKMIGFDEGMYRSYVNVLASGGLRSYPEIVAHYVELQAKLTRSVLPPMRFLYIFTAYLWHLIFSTEALRALNHVACLFSILTLLLSGIVAWRLKGPVWSLAVVGLMSCAPTQVHMSQHALVDGFFTFWALLVVWMLWETLHAPDDWRLLILYTVALSLLTLTKENSFFVWIGLNSILLANRWLKFGTVSPALILCTILGPLVGVVILALLSGGFETLVTAYRLSVTKNYQLKYAILTGDGPWYRYLVDLLLVSPIILILVFGAVFRLERTQKPELFFVVFIASSYLIMCNIKYGMNLRYANMWDMPLRFLAFSQIVALASLATRFRAYLTVVLVATVCVIELRQYYSLAVRYPLYELISEELLRALKIFKWP
jgi:4-amino-4-deoxy-L-arabinose transferase-like glycosyltransferase